jgi:hypothetical protein
MGNRMMTLATFPTFRILRAFLIATAIALLGSACGKADAPVAAGKVADAAPEPVLKDGGLTLVDFKLTKNAAGKPVIKGNIDNVATKKIAHASIDFKLLDAKDKELGTATAAVDNLEAKFSWSFEVEVLPPGVSSAKFAGFKTL